MGKKSTRKKDHRKKQKKIRKKKQKVTKKWKVEKGMEEMMLWIR